MRILCEACGAVAEARRVARPGAVALACAACGAEVALPPDAVGAPPPPAAIAATDPADEASWESLLARWDDEAAHRRYLDAQEGLEGLARAGARYREVLAARPADAAALRGRDEVLRRATARGLAALPRATPPRAPSGRGKWIALGALGALVLGAAGWTLAAALRAGAGR
jgi:hypothetical protein